MPFDDAADARDSIAAGRCCHPKTASYRGFFNGLRTFVEVEAKIAALPTSQERGDAFEVFVEAAALSGAVEQADEVWPGGTVPHTVREALNLPERDFGVDGVLRDGMDLVTYQVKFRSNRRRLLWGSKISNFVGLSQRASRLVLFTNSEELDMVSATRDNLVVVRGSDFDNLTRGQIEAIAATVSGHVPEHIKRRDPLPYQEPVIDSIGDYLDAEHGERARANIAAACGTGKTYMGLKAAEAIVLIDPPMPQAGQDPSRMRRADDDTIIVALPSLSLVRQTLKDWIADQGWGHRFRYLCVCSDETVASGDDGVVTHVFDIAAPVESDPVKIARFLRRDDGVVKVIFTTYQSSERVGEAVLLVKEDEPDFEFRFGIMDEAHKTAGRRATAFSYILHDENIPIANRLFMTATPQVYDVRTKNECTGEEERIPLLSMDDEAVYGPRAYTLSFGEARAAGAISDYKIVISVVTPADLKEVGLTISRVDVNGIAADDLEDCDVVGNIGYVDPSGKPPKGKDVALLIALRKAIEKYDCRKVITFHSSVANAERAATVLGGKGVLGLEQYVGNCDVAAIKGTQSTRDRDRSLNDFRNAERGLRSNARCLTEGVNVPAVDLVAFMAPKRSKVDIVQAVGRAIRKADGKECGYVMVPLFVDLREGESVEEAVHRSNFVDVWSVISSLMDMDYDLADVVTEARKHPSRWKERGRTKHSPVIPIERRRDMRDFVEVLGSTLSLEEVEQAIDVRIVQRLGDAHQAHLEALKKYMAANDGAFPPSAWRDEERNLGTGVWLVQWRSNAANLWERRPDILEELQGIGVLERRDTHREHLASLKDYMAFNDGMMPRTTWRDEARDLSTGTWLMKWRKNDRGFWEKRPDILEELQALGVLEQRDTHTEHLESLREYISLNGRTPSMSWRDEKRGLKTGSWLNRWRSNVGDLHTRRPDILDSLRELGALDPYDRHLKNIEALKEYMAANGGQTPPYHWRDEARGVGTGAWLHGWRVNTNAVHERRPDILAILQKLEVLHQRDAQLEHLEALKEYMEGNAGQIPPVEWRDERRDIATGVWLSRWRNNVDEYQAKRPDVFACLQELGALSKRDMETENLDALTEYVRENPGKLPPNDFRDEKTGLGIGAWLARWRQNAWDIHSRRPDILAALKTLGVMEKQDKHLLHLEALEEYMAANNRRTPPPTWRDPKRGLGTGKWLSQWRINQGDRHAKRPDILEALRELGAIPKPEGDTQRGASSDNSEER